MKHGDYRPDGRVRFIACCFELCVITLLLVLSGGTVHAQDCAGAERTFNEANALPWTMANEFKKEQLYREALALCPSHAGSHNNLGDVYERQGRFADAISEYMEAARLSGAAVAYFGVADVYFKTNRPKEALEWYEKGLALDPQDRMSAERASISRDLLASPVVRADTIRAVLSPDSAATRGPAEVVSIAFGENLIPFDFDSATIVPRARAQLDEIGKALATLPGTVIQIAGHTDSRGSDAYNLRLSDRRAQSVVSYLEANFGLSQERVQATGYGKRVPVCTVDGSEACHALNRRVELTRRQQAARPVTNSTLTGAAAPRPPALEVVQVPTRGAADAVSLRELSEPEIGVQRGFFSINQSRRIAALDENSRLRTGVDQYLIFFRPDQDSYVYVIQQDSQGKVDMLFPSGGRGASVEKGKDYWVPGFGSAFSLDQTRGEETIYLIATSWPLELTRQGAPLALRVQNAIPTLMRTRIVKVVRPSAPTSIESADLAKTPQRLDTLLETVRGRGGWVDVVTFHHD